MPSFTRFYAAGTILLLMFLMTACASVSQPASERGAAIERINARIDPLIERLYLNHKSLGIIHLDLRKVAEAHIFIRDDEQLNFIQKSSLYIQLAHQRSYGTWNMISVLAYIKPEMLRDYYTLCLTDLEQAHFETKFNLAFLETYGTFVTHPMARKAIDGARITIADNLAIYEKLQQALQPLANPKQPAYM